MERQHSGSMFDTVRENWEHSPQPQKQAELNMSECMTAEQRIAELLTPTGELAAEIIAIIDQQEASLLAEQKTDQQRAAVKNDYDITRWLLLGSGPENRLPNNLWITPYGSIGVSPNYPSANLRQLGSGPDAKESIILLNIINQNKNALEQSVESLIKASPMYALLQSFDDNTTAKPQKLNEYWKQIRTGQEEHVIKKRHGIPVSETLNQRTANSNLVFSAQKALQKAIYKIEEETMPQVTNHGSSTYEKVYAWLMTGIASQRSSSEELITSLHTDPDEDYLRGTNADGEDIWLHDDHYSFCGDLGEQLHREALTTNNREIALWLALYYSEKVIKKGPGVKHSEALDSAVKQTVAAHLDDIASDPNYHIPSIRKPSGLTYRSAPVKYITLEHRNTVQYTDVVSSEWQRELESETFGWIRSADRPYADGRIIIEAPLDQQYNPSPDRYDMSLNIDSYRYTDTDETFGRSPQIPGYDIVGRSDYTWYYERSDHDPYGPTNIEIPDERKQSLAEMYHSIGLVDLAQQVDKSESLTVDDLVQLIQIHSEYTFDDSYKLHHGQLENGLSAFTKCIDRGVLQVQCTGATQFLLASLTHAVPEIGASSASGVLLPNFDGQHEESLRINKLGHSLVRIFSKGKMFILDATPAGATEYTSTSSHTYPRLTSTTPQVSHNNARRETKPMQPQPNAQPHQIGTPIENFIEQQKPDRLKNVRSLLDNVAGNILGAKSSSKAMQLVAKLPNHDPIRTAYRIVLQLQNNVPESKIASDLQFLQNYASAEPANIKKAGLALYDQTIIQQITRSIADL